MGQKSKSKSAEVYEPTNCAQPYQFIVGKLKPTEDQIKEMKDTAEATYSKEQAKPKFNNHYLTNDMLHYALCDYLIKKAIEPEFRMPEKLGKMFDVFVDKILMRGCFRGYSDAWKGEMKFRCYENLVKRCHKYDIARGKPFAYFSTIINRCITGTITYEKKMLIKNKALDDTIKPNIDEVAADASYCYESDICNMDWQGGLR
jgi:hypothetical protein